MAPSLTFPGAPGSALCSSRRDSPPHNRWTDGVIGGRAFNLSSKCSFSQRFAIVKVRNGRRTGSMRSSVRTAWRAAARSPAETQCTSSRWGFAGPTRRWPPLHCRSWGALAVLQTPDLARRLVGPATKRVSEIGGITKAESKGNVPRWSWSFPANTSWQCGRAGHP
jgi:hypothetical protein